MQVRQRLASVIVVNFNGRKYIKECIDSVLKSFKVRNLVKSEVVVVENGSTDASLKLLKKEYGKNIKVRLVESRENLFFAGGSNLGAREAKGDWLVFLNSDAVVEPDWLEELVKAAKDKKLLLQPKILSARQKGLIDNAGGRYVWPGFGVGVGRRQFDRGQFDKNERVDFANGTCLMIDREFFFKLGGFDEAFKFFYEDVDLNLRAKKAGAKPVVVGKSVIYHLGGVSFKKNVPSDKVIYYVRRNRLVTVLKNFKGLDKWSRWFLLVLISLVSKRIKMSVKAILMSVDWLMGEKFLKMRLKELKKVMGKNKFKLLDLGCGDGRLVNLLREQGFEARGIDKKQGQLIEKFQVRDLEKYEVVSMYHVLEHIKKPLKLLGKIKKWLKDDGLLVIEVPLTGNLTEKWLKKDYLIYWDKTHVNFWTKQEFLSLIEKAGFKVVKKGLVWHQLFFHVITAKFKSGLLASLVGVGLWPWLKILSIMGFNEEMIRVYLKKE